MRKAGNELWPNSFATLTAADAQTLRIRLRDYAELYNLASDVITCDAVFKKVITCDDIS